MKMKIAAIALCLGLTVALTGCGGGVLLNR